MVDHKIPAGATHSRPHTSDGSTVYYKFHEGKFCLWREGEGWVRASCTTSEVDVIAWQGKGPAPAGTLCNLKTEQGTMHEAEIMYSSQTAVVWRWKGRTEEFGSEWNCVEATPIRTAEQIEAEERENGIEQMVQDLTYTDKDDFEHIRCAVLWEAGYRKQVAK